MTAVASPAALFFFAAVIVELVAFFLLASTALSMKAPRIGGGVIRFDGSGPRHEPILGGDLAMRHFDGRDGGSRWRDPLHSTLLGSLHTTNLKSIVSF